MPRLEALEDRTLLSTFLVTNLNDSGAGSLRAAVQSADATSGAVIDFAARLHGTITLTSGQLNVSSKMTINGPGASVITVSGNNDSRVFDIGNNATATIAGLTIANGATVGDEATPATFGGGGILNQAGSTLALTSCVVADNTATAKSNTVDVFGGGLLNEGNATVTSCIFSGNEALDGGGLSFFGGSVGGGIDNFGGATLKVTDSTFTGNKALGDGTFTETVNGGGSNGIFSFGAGGAIENNAGLLTGPPAPSTATIKDCVFTGNVAGGDGDVLGVDVGGNGGAIDNEGPGAIMTISNSTIHDNQSGSSTADFNIGLGGGLMTVAASNTTVTDSTISDNQAIAGPGEYTNGGGIVNAGSATLTLINSTVVGNQAIGGNGANGVGTMVGEALGGGIANGATLILQCSTVAYNQAIGGNDSKLATSGNPDLDTGTADGGGIENFSGSSLVLTDSTVLGNVARGGSTNTGPGGKAIGGGIGDLSGTVRMTDSTVAFNQAIGGNGGSGFTNGLAIGGGLEISRFLGSPTGPPGGPASASVIDSIFLGNQAIGGSGANAVGGGISVGSIGPLPVGLTDTSTLTLTDSTLALNLAQGGNGGTGGNGGDGLGGGLAVAAGASATVSDSTITHNQALGGEAGAGGSDGQGIGGGVYSLGDFSDVATLIVNNHASTSHDNVFP